jgi:hypothetical protein
MRALVIALTLTLAAPAVAIAQSDEEALTIPATVSDDRFELTMVSPKLVWTDKEPIEIGATLAYLGEEPVTIWHSDQSPVDFALRSIDGPYDTTPVSDLMCGRSEFGPGGVGLYPFAKSGSYDPQGELGKFWRAWFRQPELLLPVGTYQIIAYAEHGASGCDDIRRLDAALTVEVVKDWGPLAVVPEGGAGDAGLGPGRLLLTGECATFRADGGGAEVLLVWPADITEWRPQNWRIVMDQRRYGTTRLSSGDRVMIGGVPLTQDTPEETERIRAWLDASWIQPPDPSCPTEHLFHVGEVRKLN